MGVKMTMLVNIILIITLLQHTLESNIMDDENIKLSLQYLCPSVDFCIRNQTDWTIEPMDARPYGSCCIGCSCHKECALHMNCCFPYAMEEIPNSNILSTFDNGNALIEKGNSFLEINRNGLHSNEENAPNTGEIRVASGEDMRTQGHRLTTMSMSSIDVERLEAHINDTSDTSSEITTPGEVITTVNREHLTVDNGSASIDIEFYVQECMYTRTGTPNNTWIEGVPSYLMVISPPPGGCKKNTICTSLTQQNKQATCDSETVFPWGDLFPVYSDDHKLVFKNELCACCYGVIDYKPWSPLLKCDKFDAIDSRLITISEHLSFLQESKSIPDHCKVQFEYNDSRVLLYNTCYVNTIETCQLPSDFLFRVPDRVNLTRPEIITVCNIGFDAPFIAKSENGVKRLFKNVFCAICNNILIDELPLCSMPYSGRSTIWFTHLLDTASLQRFRHARKRNQVASRPNACLKNDEDWIEDSCRQIYCPSGQLRDVDGVCTYPSENWFRDGFEVTVNLNYIASNTTVLRMLSKKDVKKDDVMSAFRNTNPWPSNWVITRILHTTDDYQFGPRLVVFLLTTISRPETLAANIKTAMGLHWNIVLNGIDFAFEQSFLKYDIVYSNLHEPSETYTYAPDWLSYHTNNMIGSHIKIPLNEISLWELLVDDVMLIPFKLNKLLICEQISLLENEYTLMGYHTLLVNLLTNQVLFDKEFEVVKDENGKLVARICLADSKFVLRSEKNRASTGSNIIHHLVWVKYLIAVAIAACAQVFLRNH